MVGLQVIATHKSKLLSIFDADILYSLVDSFFYHNVKLRVAGKISLTSQIVRCYDVGSLYDGNSIDVLVRISTQFYSCKSGNLYVNLD